MSPLYLCMKLNFVSSVEDVPKTYIPVHCQWETSISPGRALIISRAKNKIKRNVCENGRRYFGKYQSGRKEDVPSRKNQKVYLYTFQSEQHLFSPMTKLVVLSSIIIEFGSDRNR